MSGKPTSRRAPAQARQNVMTIHKLPRNIERLPVVDAIAWVVEATQLTPYQVLTGPHLVRRELLAAVKRERRAAQRRRSREGERGWESRTKP
jgi:hypothetical protein